jgi:S-methylmethionine-dependent homocysteine/selenocysteine methylase
MKLELPLSKARRAWSSRLVASERSAALEVAKRFMIASARCVGASSSDADLASSESTAPPAEASSETKNTVNPS